MSAIHQHINQNINVFRLLELRFSNHVIWRHLLNQFLLLLLGEFVGYGSLTCQKASCTFINLPFIRAQNTTGKILVWCSDYLQIIDKIQRQKSTIIFPHLASRIQLISHRLDVSFMTPALMSFIYRCSHYENESVLLVWQLGLTVYLLN